MLKLVYEKILKYNSLRNFKLENRLIIHDSEKMSLAKISKSIDLLSDNRIKINNIIDK